MDNIFKSKNLQIAAVVAYVTTLFCILMEVLR